MLALLLIPGLAGPTWAGETLWQEVAPGTRARLVSSDLLKPDGTTTIGLELDMPTSTNTYWRVPGETGIPTVFDFAGSTGVGEHEVLWPYPRIETETGYVDFVYRGPTVLPIELKPDGATDIQLSVVMGICSEICVPVSASFTLPLDFSTPDPSQGLRLAQAIALNPVPWDRVEDPIHSVGYDAATNALAVQLAGTDIDPLSLIADAGEGGQLFGAPQKSPDGNLVVLPLLGGEPGRGVEGLPVRLTFMTDTGPYWTERQITSAGSTAAGKLN